MSSPHQRPRVLRIVRSTAEEDEAVALDALFEAGKLLLTVIVFVALGMAAVRWWGAS